MKSRLIYTSLILNLIVFSSKAQFSITNQGASATTILSNFAGSGLTISNAVMTCPANAYGSFTGGSNTNLGINNGIVLTTGKAANIAGLAYGNISTNNNTSCNDPDLAAIVASANKDCCTLEFDIIPQCSQLSIRFSFGSEEYPEYAGSSYNDAFGFFISGPDPLGGNYSNKNIAVLPNGTPVTINNVNDHTNQTYYVDNTNDSTVAYDGYTTALISSVDLVPCQTYHFKIAIADAGDHVYDSGVFIEFIQCSNIMTLAVSSTAATCGANNGTATATPVNGTPPYTYTWSPAPGSGQGTANAGGLIPGTTYTVIVDDANACMEPDTSFVTIAGFVTPVVTVNSATTCGAQSTTLTANTNVAGGTYLWSPGGQTSSSVTVNPSSTTSYSCAYTSNGCTGNGSGTVTVNPIPPAPLANDTSVCPGQIAILNAAAASGTIEWYSAATGGNLLASGASYTTAAINSASSFYVQNTVNGCSGPRTLVSVSINPPLTVTCSANSGICNGTSTNLTVFLPLGTNYTYTWDKPGSIGFSTGQNISVAPTSTTVYTVTASQNGCTGSSQVTITVKPVPAMNVMVNDLVCNNSNYLNPLFSSLPAGSNYTWTNSNTSIGLSANGAGHLPSFTAVNTGSSPVNAVVSVTPTLNGCTGAPASFTITVNPTPIVNPVSAVVVCNSDLIPASSYSSVPAGASFSWQNNNPNIGLGIGANGNTPAFTATNPTTSVSSANISVSPVLNGCTGTPVLYTITVNPTPGAPLANDTSYCLNTSAVPLHATASAGATLNWYGTFAAGGTASTVATTPTTTGVNTTNYYVSQTINNCEGPRTQIQVMVVAPPSMLSPADINVCNGVATLPVVFTSTPAGATFNWTNTNAGIGLAANGTGNISAFSAINPTSSIQTAVISVTPFMYSCTGQAVNFNITILPSPILTVNNVSVCNGASVPATIFSSIPAGATYTWVNSNTAIGLAANGSGSVNTFTAINPGAGLVSSIVTVSPTLNSCMGTATSYTISVKPTPAAPVVNNVSYCKDASAQALSATVSNNGTLNWYGTFATGGTASSSAAVPSTLITGTSVYYVSQTINNCEGPRAAIQVIVRALPAITLSPQVSGCAPLCSDFDATSSVQLQNLNWHMGDGSSMNGGDTLSAYCYNTAGTYNITVYATDIFGCSSTSIFNNWVSVFEVPQSVFSFSPTTTSILEPVIDFSNHSTGEYIVSYTWDFGDSSHTSSNEKSPSFNYHDTGNYIIQLIVENSYGCFDTSKQILIIEEDFAIYIPNAFSPNNDGLNETFIPKGNGINAKDYHLWVYDRWGNQLFYSNELSKGWDGKIQGLEGDVVTQDVYVWKILCRNFKGIKKQYSGTVTVIK